jgi:hypothetical protein
VARSSGKNLIGCLPECFPSGRPEDMSLNPGESLTYSLPLCSGVNLPRNRGDYVRGAGMDYGKDQLTMCSVMTCATPSSRYPFYEFVESARNRGCAAGDKDRRLQRCSTDRIVGLLTTYS